MRMHAQHPSSVLSIFSKLTSWLIQFRSQYQDNNISYLLNAYSNDEKNTSSQLFKGITPFTDTGSHYLYAHVIRALAQANNASVGSPLWYQNEHIFYQTGITIEWCKSNKLYTATIFTASTFITIIALKSLYNTMELLYNVHIMPNSENARIYYVTPYINAFIIIYYGLW